MKTKPFAIVRPIFDHFKSRQYGTCEIRIVKRFETLQKAQQAYNDMQEEFYAELGHYVDQKIWEWNEDTQSYET